MATVAHRIYFDNTAADVEIMRRFRQIRVDQAIDMATEAELHFDLALDPKGNWSDVEDEAIQPHERVRIEVKVGDGEYVALIDGPIIGQNFTFNAEPDESRLTLIAQDDSALLDEDQEVELLGVSKSVSS